MLLAMRKMQCGPYTKGRIVALERGDVIRSTQVRDFVSLSARPCGSARVAVSAVVKTNAVTEEKLGFLKVLSSLTGAN